VNPEDFSAAPTLVRKTAEAARWSAGTALNFVVEDGSADETTLAVFLASAEDLAGRLRRSGLRTGELVAIRGGGGSRAVSEAIVACVLAGLVAAPLVSLLGDADVDVILDSTRARGLLAEPAIRTRDLTGHLRRTRQRRPGVVVGGIGALAADAHFALPVTDEHPEPVDWSAVRDGSLGFVLFSSGTTGVPKGVMHSYGTIDAEVHDFADQLDLLRDGHLLQPFPLGHIGGITGLFICVTMGRHMTQLNSWNAAVAADAIDHYGVTGSGTSPYFVQTLLEERERRGTGLETLRALESGGGRVGRELVYRAARLGLRLSRGYGSTEHPTATTHHADDPLEQRAESDGLPLNGTRIRIVGPDGQNLPAGGDGEVLLAGPEQTLGYLSGDASAFVDGEWFRTGDIGRLTDTGELVITGRIKEIIIRGGENISASEVEQLLQEHPDIAEAAVVGMPDVKFGERAHAFIVLRPDSGPVDLKSIRSFFDERRVSKFKTPEYVTTVPRLPRNGMGKVQKHLLVSDPAPRDT
jgi:acyl-CoA synthetase (AMP-forming)/AMP-acid ligase II